VVRETYKSGPRKGQEATDWQGSAAQAKRADIEARGYVPCLPSELESASELAGRVRAELIVAGLDLSACKLQETMQWTTPLGVEAEGTPDAIILVQDRAGFAHTLDLKVGDDANPEKLDSQVDAMYWDMQGSVYQEALNVTGGTTGTHWLCRVDASTKIVGLYPLSESYLMLGRHKWEAAQRIWVACRATNEWPQYERRAIMPSKRAIARALERGFINEESNGNG
jgi:hypothetical protein